MLTHNKINQIRRVINKAFELKSFRSFIHVCVYIYLRTKSRYFGTYTRFIFALYRRIFFLFKKLAISYCVYGLIESLSWNGDARVS